MASESRANDADRGEDGDDLEDKVSTFGEDLAGLSDAELERRAEDYLGFEGTWTASGVGHGDE